MTGMTPTQANYLSYIRAYIAGFGLPPAESEIAKAIGVSAPSVNQMIRMLEKKGFIRRQPGVARSIEILVDGDAIPHWKGKRLTRTVTEWTISDSAKRRFLQQSDESTEIYRFKIVLKGAVPVIWRRIETRNASLEELHELIQSSMGWHNSHLHQFEIAGKPFTSPKFMESAVDDFGAVTYAGLRISDVAKSLGAKFKIKYEYDFGDSWQHEILLEDVSVAQSGIKYPRCVAGKRACPPEDIGGVWGFRDYVEAIKNPNHRSHEEMLESYGPFDPAEFDADEATRRMQAGLPTW